jgi:hypothetical protein
MPEIMIAGDVLRTDHPAAGMGDVRPVGLHAIPGIGEDRTAEEGVADVLAGSHILASGASPTRMSPLS